MVQVHGCASKVEEVSKFHETRDTKLPIVTFLSQANMHLISHALVCRPSALARAYKQTYTFQTQQKEMVGLSGMAGWSN